MGYHINCYYWSISNFDNFVHGEHFQYSQIIQYIYFGLEKLLFCHQRFSSFKVRRIHHDMMCQPFCGASRLLWQAYNEQVVTKAHLRLYHRVLND
jgi:hypothetical protein